MSRRSSRSKPNATGRNTSSRQRFSMLPHKVQYSRAYADLSPNAKALLIELIGRYNGKNNGDLALSETDAARRIGIKSRKTAGKAFGELLDVGLIAMTSDAYFHIKTGERRSRRWRLSWIFDNHNRKPASNEWQKYNQDEA